MSETREERRRDFGAPVSHERAEIAAQRFIDLAFNNKGERPQLRIPADPNDDDLVLGSYIRQQKALEQERDELRAKAALADRLREDLKQAFAVESVMDVMSEFETAYDSLIQEGKADVEQENRGYVVEPWGRDEFVVLDHEGAAIAFCNDVDVANGIAADHRLAAVAREAQDKAQWAEDFIRHLRTCVEMNGDPIDVIHTAVMAYERQFERPFTPPEGETAAGEKGSGE